MNQPPQTGKRIVSRGEYVKVQAKRASFIGSAGLLAMLGTLCMGLLIVPVFWLVISCIILDGAYFPQGNGWFSIALCLLATSLFGFGAYICAKLSDASVVQANKMEEVTLLSRANIADLPASDSLVRASEEPIQEQEAVLLRAAIAGVEKYEEQLVRAATGVE